MKKLLGSGVVSGCLALMSASSAMAQYTVKNLVANNHSYGRVNTDPRLINGWGLAALAATPFWVSDNGTGLSTLYDGIGNQIPLVVTIPPAPSMPLGPQGTPTGQVANSTQDFVITENGKSGPALFIFATLDGTISGWNPAVDLTHAVIMVDNSANGAVYTGLAIGQNSSGQNVLYAGDASGMVEGVTQLNIRVPTYASNGNVQLTVGNNWMEFGISIGQTATAR